jgi:hypothetical protein
LQRHIVLLQSAWNSGKRGLKKAVRHHEQLVKAIQSIAELNHRYKQEKDYRWSVPHHFFLAAHEHYGKRTPRKNIIEIAANFAGRFEERPRVCAGTVCVQAPCVRRCR